MAGRPTCGLGLPGSLDGNDESDLTKRLSAVGTCIGGGWVRGRARAHIGGRPASDMRRHINATKCYSGSKQGIWDGLHI